MTSPLAWQAVVPDPERDKPLRIALFSGNYNCVRDGANQALNRLVGYLLEQTGAEIRIYSPTIPSPAFPPTGELVSVPSVPLPGRSEYRLALGLPKKIRVDLERFKPDIVHLSAPDWLGRAAQLYAKKRQWPVVASLHTRFESYLEHYGLRWLKSSMEQYLAGFYADCNHVLVPNTAILEEFGAAGLGDRTSIWGRGVDRTRFHPTFRDMQWRREHGFADEEVVPLFFGRLVREKGIDRFIAVIEGLRAQGYPVRPIIVGDGPARRDFEERLPNALFLGHLDGRDIGRAVASSDILINPSQTEAFGNVTLEAMASGIAIVSANVSSASCLVEDCKSALLVPPQDTNAYVNAVIRLICSPELRSYIVHQALEEATAYEWDRVCEAVDEAYRQCLVL